MYHPQTRPLSTLPAAALDLSSWVHQLSAKTSLPLPTPARLLSLFPGADLSALSRLLVTSPLHVDTVAKAACEAIMQADVQGPIGVDDIQKLARSNSSAPINRSTMPSSSPPWPSQNINASATMGQRSYSTSTRPSRQSREQQGEEKKTTTAFSITSAAAAIALLITLQHMSHHPLQNESASMTQQELMRARANSQGVYAWGSNRFNVVAPDSPLTTFVKTPRSIPYFDGMALRDLSLEERHGVAVDANGDVLQWGLGFFDATLETRIQENLDDVPLGRRREKEKANELTPRGSLGAQPLAPVKTLVGKDIIKLATSDTKIYALSKKGKVYVFSAVQARQWPGKSPGWSLNPLSLFGFLGKSNIDHEELKALPAAKFGRGEKIDDIHAGSHHVLALSNKGRTFSTPIDTDGNAYGQLGTRRIVLGVREHLIETVMEARMLTEVEQRPTFRQTQVLPAWALPPGFDKESQTNKPVTGPTNRGIYVRTRTNDKDQSSEVREEVIAPVSNIRYCTTLHEIPTLKGLEVAQIAAGSDHSIARTKRGQVLGWGRQTHGQTGLGAQIALEAVPVPTEVVLARAFANTSVDIHCTDVNAGADNSFFTMSRREPGGAGTGHRIDVLAVGKGQWGSLGNAMWSQVTLTPVKVKTISGLIEYSERTGTTHPVPIHTISVGKPGSIALVLDTVEHEGHQAFGRDVMVFGHNAAYQLGTSKRSNLCIPQHLQPLPPQTPEEGAQAPLPLLQASKLIEEDLNSGVLTHMPHKRLQLVSATKQDTKTAGKSLSIEEKRGTKRNVEIEESIIAGAVSMAVYWKVHV